MTKPKPPELTAADFSIDGSRVRRNVSKWLHGLGWRYCRRCNDGQGAVRPLASFTRHDRAYNISPYCKDCLLKLSRANHQKEHKG